MSSHSLLAISRSLALCCVALAASTVGAVECTATPDGRKMQLFVAQSKAGTKVTCEGNWNRAGKIRNALLNCDIPGFKFSLTDYGNMEHNGWEVIRTDIAPEGRDGYSAIVVRFVKEVVNKHYSDRDQGVIC